MTPVVAVEVSHLSSEQEVIVTTVVECVVTVSVGPEGVDDSDGLPEDSVDDSDGLPEDSVDDSVVVLPEDSDGLTEDSVGVVDDSDGLPEDSVGVVDDSDGLTEDSVGVVDDSDGLPEDSVGVVDDSDGLPEDSVGVVDDSVGGVEDSVGGVDDSVGGVEDSVGGVDDSVGGVDEVLGGTVELLDVDGHSQSQQNCLIIFFLVVHFPNKSSKNPKVLLSKVVEPSTPSTTSSLLNNDNSLLSKAYGSKDLTKLHWVFMPYRHDFRPKTDFKASQDDPDSEKS